MAQRGIPFFFFSPSLLYLLYGFGCEFLAEHALHHVLFAGPPVPDHDQDTAGDVACDGAAEDHGCEGKGTDVVVDTPRAGTKGDLQHGVAVEYDDDGDEETEREGVVGDGFVGFVEGVRFGEFLLVMDETELLDTVEDTELVLLVFGGIAEFDVDVDFAAGGEVIFVLERGQFALLADLPG